MENELEERVYFSSICNLDQITIEHPDYVRVFACVEERIGKTIIRPSKGHGDFLLLVSNVDHKDMSRYFGRKSRTIEKRSQDVPESTGVQAKRPKQQTLLGLFKKLG